MLVLFAFPCNQSLLTSRSKIRIQSIRIATVCCKMSAVIALGNSREQSPAPANPPASASASAAASTDPHTAARNAQRQLSSCPEPGHKNMTFLRYRNKTAKDNNSMKTERRSNAKIVILKSCFLCQKDALLRLWYSFCHEASLPNPCHPPPTAPCQEDCFNADIDVGNTAHL